MFWLTVKERFVVVCPNATTAEDTNAAAKTADFINLLWVTTLIECIIMQISQSFATMFCATSLYGVAVR